MDVTRRDFLGQAATGVAGLSLDWALGATFAAPAKQVAMPPEAAVIEPYYREHIQQVRRGTCTLTMLHEIVHLPHPNPYGKRVWFTGQLKMQVTLQLRLSEHVTEWFDGFCNADLPFQRLLFLLLFNPIAAQANPDTAQWLADIIRAQKSRPVWYTPTVKALWDEAVTFAQCWDKDLGCTPQTAYRMERQTMATEQVYHSLQRHFVAKGEALRRAGLAFHLPEVVH